MSIKISNSDFVHLHVHTAYSLFDGLATVDGLVMKAREMGFPALAITDHGTGGGWIRFIQSCNSTKDKKGLPIKWPIIKPIIGNEMYLSRYLKGEQSTQPDGKSGNRHLVLLALNSQGYKNLCTLQNISQLQGFYYSPRIDIDTLAKYSEGLFCSSACLASVINANLRRGKYKEARQAAGILKDIFKENFALELMYHGIASEYIVAPLILKLGKELDIPVIATNDLHYITRDQAESQEVFMCMSTGTCIKDPKRLRHPYPNMYLKSAEEMAEMFGDFPEVLYNTKAIADRVDAKDIEKYLFGGMRLPIYKVPQGFNSPIEYLGHLAKDGLKKRGWEDSQKHIDRLNLELNDIKVAWEINEYDFATYLLIVRDYINYAIENNVPVGPGRGSGYGGLLLHCLGICRGPDPLKYNLLWERFLGFDDLRFIKESDFGYVRNMKKVPYKVIADIKVEILESLFAIKDEETRKIIDFELSEMESTEGLNDKNNLLTFYDIWKSHNEDGPGPKNEINSHVAFLLGMTSVQPTKDAKFMPARRAYARVGFPDVDTDFGDDLLHKVLEYLSKRHGSDRVSKIGTYGTMGLRSYITRVTKALDLAGAFHEGEEFTPKNMIKIEEILKDVPKMGVLTGKDLKTGETIKINTVADAVRCFKDFAWYVTEKYPDILRHSKNIGKLIQNFGTHASGVVVSDVPMNEIVPVAEMPKGITTQFTMEEIESLGLIKFDFLGLSTMSTVYEAVRLIKENYDIDIDIYKLEPDDKETFDLYKKGNLAGVFQCEEHGMQNAMMSISPTSFEDIAAAVALYRPGPKEFIPQYCARKRGEQRIDYFHPSIEKHVKKHLEKTYGIIVYQEQIMQICHDLAGFSIAEGYVVIKAIGKKKEVLLKQQKEKFKKGCVRNGVPENIAEMYWEKCIVPFANYGFNASHAVAYGFLSYVTAYLKTHYPEEFMTALLNTENLRKQHESVEEYEKSLSLCGIKLGPKTINECGVKYKIRKKANKALGEKYSEISPSLVVKGIGENMAKIIEENQPYKDFRDLIIKTGGQVGKKAVDSLYDGGFFDSLKKKGKRITKGDLFSALENIKDDMDAAARRGVESQDMFAQ